MKEILQKLLLEAPVATDGAWRTELESSGLEAGECPDAWNLSRPQSVESVARSYVEAGSRIILTNTFRSNRLALDAHALVEKLEQLNRAGVELSRKASGGKSFVFATMGPASTLTMGGNLPPDAVLKDVFREQAIILANAGVDGIVLESFHNLHELLIALHAAKSTNLPVVASVVFDSGDRMDRMASGQSPELVALTLAEAGADVIGANCGMGIEQYLPICRRLHTATYLPIWMKPNAGKPTLIHGKIVYPTTGRNFAMYAQVLANLGADFVGGCCGTTPEYIHEMVRTLRKKYRDRMITQF
ncbi:MAG TPA: homocysteine S-methyltransferase family protein [Bacteroidota bacterium]|nr:homocysteine S-methyltransferase family protein [Bacteroidota bacterium]